MIEYQIWCRDMHNIGVVNKVFSSETREIAIKYLSTLNDNLYRYEPSRYYYYVKTEQKGEQDGSASGN